MFFYNIFSALDLCIHIKVSKILIDELDSWEENENPLGNYHILKLQNLMKYNINYFDHLLIFCLMGKFCSENSYLLFFE